MNKRINKIISMIIGSFAFLVISCVSQQTGAPIISPNLFPAAPTGYKKIVLKLPDPKKSSLTKIDLIVGKYQFVDCNEHVLNGQLKTTLLEGYGIPYYTFITNNEIYSTKMTCPDASLREAFIHAAPMSVAYQKQIIVYIPNEYALQYRIWTAPDTQTPAQK